MRVDLAAGQRTVLSVVVNGRSVSIEVEPDATLVDVLRDGFGLSGTRVGCRTGDCGACTVVLNARTVKSCLELAVAAAGSVIETIESMGSPGALHPIQEAFDARFAYQCGFCLPGMLLCVREAIEQAGGTTDAELSAAIDGNLCRCTGYVNILEALRELAAGSTATT